MSEQHRINLPGQFAKSAMMVLAIRGKVTDPLPAPTTADLTGAMNDEYKNCAAAALTSAYTRDILDGATAAMILGPDAEDLILLFEEIIADCHDIEKWTVLEAVAGVTLESTLFMIEVDLLMAVEEIGSPLGLSLALRALSDQEDGLHVFAIDAIKSIGPAAAEAVPNLLQYIQAFEPTGLSNDHREYRRTLRRNACEALGVIRSPDGLTGLLQVAEGGMPLDVRLAAFKAIDPW
jgi:HEAT repeat protein